MVGDDMFLWHDGRMHRLLWEEANPGHRGTGKVLLSMKLSGGWLALKISKELCSQLSNPSE